jgi:hypothetical protein
MKSAKILLVVLSFAGCTANVENPKVNQQGRGGDTTTCVMDCDSTQTTCVAKCNDDACKASCSTAHSNCTSACTPTTTTSSDADAGH